ncbi:MAG: (d)CMP kinase [Candidatus Thorarchaeota archaeon]
MVKLTKDLRTYCIAISGSHGAGTSTAAKNIAESLNLKLVSAGAIFRESAKKRKIDIKEFTRIVEGDGYLKEELDELIRAEARKGGVVVEGRISCWTAGEFADLRVMIDAPFGIRVKRISQRGKSEAEAKHETIQRDNEEHQWFLRNYGIDIYDNSIYDLIINTERLGPNQVTSIIEAAIFHHSEK